MRWSTYCMWGVFPKLCQNAWKLLVKNTAGFNGYITGAIRRKFSKVRIEADLLPWRNSRKVPRKREIRSNIHQCAAAFKFASCIRYPGASTVNRVILNLHPFENIFRFRLPIEFVTQSWLRHSETDNVTEDQQLGLALPSIPCLAEMTLTNDTESKTLPHITDNEQDRTSIISQTNK